MPEAMKFPRMRRRWPRAFLPAALAACSSSAPLPEAPDHTRVFETRIHDKTAKDAPFPFEVVTLFRTEDTLAALEVTRLMIAGERPYAGTSLGLFRLDAAGRTFERVEAIGDATIVDLVFGSEGVIVAEPHRVRVLDAGGAVTRTLTSPTSTITAVATLEGTIIAGTTSGLERLEESGVTHLADAGETAVRDLLSAPDGSLWVATSSGVLKTSAAAVVTSRLTAPEHLADNDARAIALDASAGEVAIATRNGIARLALDGSVRARLEPKVGELPNGDLRAIAAGGGHILSGHAIGATVLEATRRDHYHTPRWIPADEVTAVALGPDGTRWIGTAAGISRIAFTTTTLREKADHFEEVLRSRHVRMGGFVTAGVRYTDPWDLSGEPQRWDDDNDGQWTETQLGTWCFAYAATKELRYLERARATMQVMLQLIDVPRATFEGLGRPPGFVSRSLVRDDEGEVFRSKESQANWHRQEHGGRTYYWKDNTSADEYDGHFFGLPLYYDLCAEGEEERSAIRERLRLAMDYLISNDYVLIDLDGQPTEDGRWRDLAIAADGLDACVERLGEARLADCVFSRHGGGWLNSIEVLAYLLATWHVTGDAKYLEEYERLHTQERYGEMIPVTEDVFTVTEPGFANHSDHEMAMLAFHTLLRYEPYPERRERWTRALLDFFEHERPERNPFEVAVVASAWSADADLDGALQTLRDLSLDRRSWRYDNSHRLDLLRGPPDRFMKPQFRTVPPYDEIRAMKWNESPYAIADGGDGTELVVPMPYLTGYWMLRYYGLIDSPN